MNGTRPVVYASLHGHSHYSTPTSHIHVAGILDSSDIQMLYDELQIMSDSRKSSTFKEESFFGFGARDDVAKGDNVMDIASTYNVICVDYMESGIEPWLDYTGRWGPKITYEFTEEMMIIADSFPHIVRKLVIKLLKKLPPELLGEEGPQGPKMKESWTGDERV
ncbi:putative vacuolar protein sorting-associated protein [Helianthus anomalus]